MFKKFHKRFGGPKIVRTGQKAAGIELLKKLEIRSGDPVIAFLSDESQWDSKARRKLERAIQEGIALAAVKLGALVVDSGLRKGIPGMMNTALAAQNHKGAYIGVAPEALVALPGEIRDRRSELGSAHTHFILVDGAQWGDELPTLYNLVNALAQGAPAIVILVTSMGGHQNPAWTMANPSDYRPEASQATNGCVVIRYSGNTGETGIEKLLQGDGASVIDFDLDPTKLANVIMDYLKS